MENILTTGLQSALFTKEKILSLAVALQVQTDHIILMILLTDREKYLIKKPTKIELKFSVSDDDPLKK